MDGERGPPGVAFEPAPLCVLSALEELRVVSTPLRRSILDCLIPAERTVKEVGRVLGVDSTKLYYHVGELERVGLVRLSRHEVRGGIQQKFYRATARYYRVASGLLNGDGDATQAEIGADFVVGTLEYSSQQLRQAYATGTVANWADLVIAGRRIVTLSPERAAHLRDRLAAVIEEFVAADDDERAGGLRLELAYALFPRADDGGSGDERSGHGTQQHRRADVRPGGEDARRVVRCRTTTHRSVDFGSR